MEQKEVKEMTEAKTRGELTLIDLPGVGAATAEKLSESGFDSVMSIAVATPGELIESAGISEAVARKMINTAQSELRMGFESGDEMLKRRERVVKISTGSPNFN